MDEELGPQWCGEVLKAVPAELGEQDAVSIALSGQMDRGTPEEDDSEELVTPGDAADGDEVDGVVDLVEAVEVAGQEDSRGFCRETFASRLLRKVDARGTGRQGARVRTLMVR